MIKKATLTAIVIMVFASFATAQITYLLDVIVEHEEDQTVYFTITIKDVDYEFHARTPLIKGTELLQWFKDRQDKIYRLIIMKMYPGSDYGRFRTEDNTELEAILAWVQDGHKNQIIIGYDEDENLIYNYVIIEKKPFKSTHPMWVKAEKMIDEISNLEELKAFLKKIIRYIK